MCDVMDEEKLIYFQNGSPLFNEKSWGCFDECFVGEIQSSARFIELEVKKGSKK